MMKQYTQLPPVAMYLILTIAVFSLSPLLYEVIRRIPVINWCVLGEKMHCKGNKTTDKDVTEENTNNT